MATPFDCRFASLGNINPGLLPAIPILIPDTDGSYNPIEDVFYLASGQSILLQPNFAFLHNPFEPTAETVSAASLHAALPQITQNPPHSFPVPRLGVIFSNEYSARENVFGMMFDTGLVDPDNPQLPVDSLPREGCAIFLKTIRRLRPNDRDYTNQVAFDLMHELGHIFNLHHHTADEKRVSFMNVSLPHSPPPTPAFDFLSYERTSLQQCGSNKYNTPGGDPFDSDAIGNEDSPPRGHYRQSSKLKIKISMTHLEFWPWDPVELEIALFANQTISIPDQIDPGYKSFEIWIENPSGERRRYRSLNHYCAYPKLLHLSPSAPYVRDISIFQQAGGYTFKKSGIYRVWVALQTSRSQWIQSNHLEISVKSQRFTKPSTRQAVDKVRHLQQIGSRALFFKSGPFSKREAEALKHLSKIYSKEPAGASAQYALGRLYIDQARRFPKSKREWIRKATPYLRSSRNHSHLNEHSRKKAIELVAEK